MTHIIEIPGPAELALAVYTQVTEHPETHLQACYRIGCCSPIACCVGGWAINFAGIQFSPHTVFAYVQPCDLPVSIASRIELRDERGYSAGEVARTLLGLEDREARNFFMIAREWEAVAYLKRLFDL